MTLLGTYVVNADCTGTMTLAVAPFGITGHLDFIIDEDGTEIRALVTDTGNIETRTYKKQQSNRRDD